MKRKSKIGLAAAGVVALAGVGIGIGISSDDIFFQVSDSPVPAQTPLYMRDSVPPLNMLVMGKDHKIYYEAYNDASDLDGDGIVDVGYRGWERKSPEPTEGSPFKIDYYGYFDSFLCYNWNGNEFVPQGQRTTNKKCSGAWSGDFLNYATMSRMDTLRRVLYGGYRVTDTTSRTILQGAFFPQDAHSWGKEYQSVERDGYDIREYTPINSLPSTGRYHLFAVTTRSGNLAAYPNYQAPMLRTLRNTTARVWNWVAMEGPVAGDHCFQQGTPCVGGGAHPGHPNNRAEFNSMESTSAISANLLRTDNPSNINCTSNCGAQGQHDNYLTIIDSELRIRDGGVYQFAIDGDDAVDFRIHGLLDIIGNVDAGWYGGHGACSTNQCLLDHSTDAVTLIRNTTYRITFRHEEAEGADSYALYYRTRSGTTWSSWQIVPGTDNNGNFGIRNAVRRTYRLGTNNAFFEADKYVRVETCPANAVHRDSTCKAYPNGTYKPVGILHEYGEEQKMYFGLITGTQANNLQGGVLRRNIENFANEVDQNTGQLMSGVNGIVRNIDRLRMIGGAYNGGGDNTSSQKNWNWANAEGGLGGYCESQGGRILANGECRMWGNPIAEMMFESVRYFAGAESPTSLFSTGGSSQGQAEDRHLGMSTPSWRDPYRPSPAGGGYPTCSRPVMTLISDINPSYDGELPGSAFASRSADPAAPGFNAAALGQEIWDDPAMGLGGTRTVFIGEAPGNADGRPTPKRASSLGNIRGLAPEEPSKTGTYYSASVARYGARNRINSRADYPWLTTYAVALASPLPRMEIPVGTGANSRMVQLLPYAMTVSGTFGGNTRKPVNTIVDFFVEQLVNFPGGVSAPNINGGLPQAVFRINYEDVEQGNDHDMDAIVRYTIRANPGGSTVTVNLDSEYAAGSANQNIGYVISGTTKDGVYLEVRDRDNGNQASSAYELNTPAGRWAGECIGLVGSSPCNAGLPFNASRTFTVGSGTAGERLRDPLWYAAMAGTPNGVNPDENGDGEPDNYFLVTNPLTMRNQLAKAFDSAAALDLELGTQSIVGARVGGGGSSFTLQPSFSRERNGKDWTGNLTAIEVTSSGALGNSLWTASAGIPAANERKIFAIHTVGNGQAGNGGVQASPFTTVGLPGDNDAELRLLGINPGQVASRYGNAYTSADFISYLRGAQANEEGRGGTLRARSSVLGSIINSEPVIASNRSNYGYGYYPNTKFNGYGMFDGYEEYLDLKRRTGNTMVYVGANDGMLHAFNGNTRPCELDRSRTCAMPGAGREEFAFIPNGILNPPGSAVNKLGDLALRDNLFEHHYYVDGQIAVSDAKKGADWKTVLAATTGGGGRSIFALDVSKPLAFDQSAVLWERNHKVDPDIGYLQGRPLIVPLENGSWGVLFGNGFGGAASDPSLYVLDAFTGAVIRKITADDGHPARPRNLLGSILGIVCDVTDLLCTSATDPFNGLGQITAIDKNGNGLVDAVYGADLQGNLWKFDLTNEDAKKWDVAYDRRPLFVAEVGGERQPITGGIRVAAGPGQGVMVYFGTGRYQYQPDNTVPETPQVQSLYGIYDNGATRVPTQTGSGGRGYLARQLVTSESTSADDETVRNISRSAVRYFGSEARRGWFIDLAVVETPTGPTSGRTQLRLRGERFIAAPRIQSGRVFFTTYTPLEDSCNPGGVNFVYGLDLLSGGAALSNVQQLGDDTPACTDGNCGAVAVGSGADASDRVRPPITATGFAAITPVERVDETCDPATESCASFERCQVVIYPGAFVLPRPCGRQSWRQLR